MLNSVTIQRVLSVRVSVLLLIVLLVFLLAGCTGGKVTYQGEDVTNEEAVRFAQAMEVIKMSWLSVLSAAELRYTTGQLSEAHWVQYKDELGPEMVERLEGFEEALGRFAFDPSPLNRTEVLSKAALVRLTMGKTVHLASETLGEAFQ